MASGRLIAIDRVTGRAAARAAKHAAARCSSAVLLLPVVWGAFVGGCAVSRGPLNVQSHDPAIKVPAMKRAGEERRQADLPALVEGLDDPDPAVRMFSIQALRRITGETFGYNYYDHEVARAKSIARWRDYAGMSTTRPSAGAGPSTGTALTAPVTAETAGR